MPYPNNVEGLAKKRHVSILYIIALTRPGIELPTFWTGGLLCTDAASTPGMTSSVTGVIANTSATTTITFQTSYLYLGGFFKQFVKQL